MNKLEDQYNFKNPDIDFFRKTRSNLNISFNRIAFIFIFVIVLVIFLQGYIFRIFKNTLFQNLNHYLILDQQFWIEMVIF